MAQHPSLLTLNISSIRVFSNELAICIRWPKYWSFSFSTNPFNEYSGLISCRIDWYDLFAVQWTLKRLLQYHSSKASVLQCSTFFTVQLSYPYMTTGKTIALTIWIFISKVISLLFKMLCRFVIASLPTSKHLSGFNVVLSKGFPREERWSGLPFPSPGTFPPQGLTRVSCVSCPGRRALHH